MQHIDDVIQQPGQKERDLRDMIFQSLQVALVGQVVSFDPSTQTASIQPLIRNKQGERFEELPLLQDVPVFFPGSTGQGVTWPVQAGDECLVVFANSCIDAWLQNGGVQNPISVRHHDYSDGFAFVGFRSNPKVIVPFIVDEPAFFGKKLSEM